MIKDYNIDKPDLMPYEHYKWLEEPTFILYIKDERVAFVMAINKQKWSTEMRAAAEDLLIAYDQMADMIEHA